MSNTVICCCVRGACVSVANVGGISRLVLGQIGRVHNSAVLASAEFLFTRDVHVVATRLHVPSAPLHALRVAHHVHCTFVTTLVAFNSLVHTSLQMVDST